MKSYFTPLFFAENRRHLQQAVDTDIIVIPANGLIQRGADTTFPFQQDANFWYLTGINEPDITLVIGKTETYLIVPSRSDSRQAFDGTVSYDELQKISGIKTVLGADEGWQRLAKALNKYKKVGVLAAPPSYIEMFGFYVNPARERLQKMLLEHREPLNFEDVSPYLRTMRAVKQPSELQAIKQAIKITGSTLEDVFKKIASKKYTHEYEIEADISQGFRARGARGHAFEPIVAAGKRACTLHYIANNGTLKNKDFIVIDVGAEFNNYAADITRTVCLGQPTERQQAVYEAVQAVQQYALSILKPGVLMKEYEQAVQDVMAEKLQKLGLIKSSDTSEIRKYYPHATSHFLGLNVHDVGNYDRPLEANMVITVEPGIYVPQEGIGVRIEDDVLITETGNKVLSNKLPKHL